jgi:Fur family transcriptional regulator, peroxide stress response regulator
VVLDIGNREVERRISCFEHACRESGVKLTHQRREIFREVAQSGDHPDAETVYENVRNRIPTVSLDTVYRTLWLLRDLGLINTIGAARERTRFDANLSRHHHFVCSRCGLTRDFYSEAFDDLDIPESISSIGHVEATHVEIRGVCISCSREAGTEPHTRK